MAERKINWTPQQALAIQRRNSSVLVTASAGTGKTAVLSGRCVSFIADKGLKNSFADMLLLTFTDAAAEQMQSRIRRRLYSLLPSHPEKARITNEISLLPAADISTIHSFCKKIISEFFYKLAIDPTFRVIDEDEQRLLKFQSLEKTIEWAWQQDRLQPDLEIFFNKRDPRIDGFFSTKIIALSDFLDTIPSREYWFDRTQLLSEQTDPSSSLLGQKQKELILDRLQKILKRLSFCQKLLKTPQPWQTDFTNLLKQSVAFFEEGNWDKAFENIRNFQRPARISKPKDVDSPVAEIIRDNLKSAVDEFAALNNLAVLNPDYLNTVGVSVHRQTRLVIELVKKFDDFYSQAKLSANCLDFADLEHYALMLLAEPDASAGNLKPSQTALLLRRKYKYVFVDEYQDINPVQEAILNCISIGDNIFVVGDIKQSIYAFRGAEPKIFLEHLKPASLDPHQSGKPLRIDLNANFRSSSAILDFVNTLFSKIMTSSLSDIDYDSSAALISADNKQMSDAKTPLVELHIIDKDISADNDEPDGQAPSEQGASDFAGLRQCQAFLIADRIRQMVGADTGRAEFKIYDRDNDVFRDVRYADIAVLMRSPAKRINDYIKIFQLLGVPVSTQASEFFEATEISDMLCLLKVLDNSQRDIELSAVLRSPLFSLTDTALAQIKIFSRESPARKSFYDSVLEYSINGPDKKLSEKLGNILDCLNRWRLLAKSGSIADLIWLIYRQSGLLSFVSALPGGPLRRSNLLKLHDRAVQFELFATSSAFLSLSRFVAFIEKLQQTEAKWASAEPEDLDQNAVLITSVHKSKGLEFPVVFLAELDDKFNYNDLSDDFLADPDLTFGLQVIDPASGKKISSLAHQVIAEKKLKSLLAEEMRILYVALTRATARLVLTGSMKRQRCCDILINGLFSQDASSADLQLESCKNYLEWILYALSDRKPLHDSFRTGFKPKPCDDNLFSFRLYNSADVQKFSNAIEKCRLDKKIKINKVKPADKSLQSQLINQLKENFSWVYQYQRSSLLPAKRTVTLITHNNNEFVRLDHSMALERKPKAYAPSKNLDIDVRLAGQALHLLISSLDLSHPVTKQHIQAVANELIERGFIDSNFAKTIDIDSILVFFMTDLGKMVFDSENSVFREWPFTISIPASELAESNYESRATSHERQATSDDFIVVQGMIDMLIKTASGLVVIDFKTDNVTADRCFERAKIYQAQLDLYARAAADVFGLQVLKKCLYFLKPAKLIELP